MGSSRFVLGENGFVEFIEGCEFFLINEVELKRRLLVSYNQQCVMPASRDEENTSLINRKKCL